MEIKFIELTKKFGGGLVHINPNLISFLDPNPGGYTSVHMMGGQSTTVAESVDEIKKLINKSNKYTITYDQPG